MISIEDLKSKLKQNLSEHRYEHSIGVMEKALELAKKYNYDEEKAALVGLAHDMAKEMTKNESLNYIKENGIEITKYDLQSPQVLHGIIAADITKKKCGFDKEMQQAIYYHTTARENMTLLDKILYIADKTEERTKKYDKLDKFRKIIEDKGLDVAIVFVIENYTIPKAIQNGQPIHPNSIYARNDLLSTRLSK